MSILNTKDETPNKKEGIYEYLFQNNDPTYNLVKAAEELQELSLVLLQRVNKGERISDQQIIDEIGDVKIRVKVLEKMFSKELVSKRVNKKLTQYQFFIDTEKHKNI